MLTLIALCASADEIDCNEIGGVNDRRRSNPAGFRSRLTFRSLLQQFPPIRGLLVCDDTAVSQISRLSSAPFVGAPQETSHTPWTSWPQEPESRHFALRQKWQVAWPPKAGQISGGVGSEQYREVTPIPALMGWPLSQQNPLTPSRIWI